MCKVNRCKRHEFDRGLCYTHLVKEIEKEGKKREKATKYEIDLETRNDG